MQFLQFLTLTTNAYHLSRLALTHKLHQPTRKLRRAAFYTLYKAQPRFIKKYCACIFGLSTHKVCRCPFCRQKSGSLLHYLFTLTKHITMFCGYSLWYLLSYIRRQMHAFPLESMLLYVAQTFLSPCTYVHTQAQHQ